MINKYSQVIGDGIASSFKILHNLNTKDVIIQLFYTDNGAAVMADIGIVDNNTVYVNVGAPLTNGELKVVVIG